jgi:hypothetical protein
MTWESLDPPEDSCFILDKDDQGFPRLSWNLPQGPIRDFGKAYLSFFLGLWILAGLVVAVCLFVELVALMRGNGRASIIIWLTIWLMGWTSAAYCMGRILHKYLLDPDPENVTLTDTLPKYDPGFSKYYRVLAQRGITTLPKRTEISRRRIWEIRWQRGSTFWTRLVGNVSVRFGYDRLEIGPSLSDSELEWLTEILRDWVSMEHSVSSQIPSPTNQSQPRASPKSQ